jgi:hypothetical protein
MGEGHYERPDRTQVIANSLKPNLADTGKVVWCADPRKATDEVIFLLFQYPVVYLFVLLSY